MSTFVRNPNMCSRCGAVDGRHSVKCYQAMALGMAMGMEPHPHVESKLRDIPDQPWDYLPGGGIVTYPKGDDDVVERLREDLRLAHQELRKWQHDYRVLREQHAQLQEEFDALREQQTGSEALADLVTHLPEGYHDANLAGKLRLQREREIEAEIQAQLIEDAKASDKLVVEERDGATIIRPLRDDDPPHEVDEFAHMRTHYDQTGQTETAPPHEDTEFLPNQDWAAYVREQRTRLGLTNYRLGKLVGCSHQSIQDWANGKNVPGERWHDKLRALADIQPEEEAAPAPTPEPDTQTTQEAEAAEPEATEPAAEPDVYTSAAEFVAEQVIVADAPPRTDLAGRTWDPGYVLASEFMDAFRDWAAEHSKPFSVKAPFALGTELRKIAPLVKQGPTHDVPRKPTSYFGLMLASQVEELTRPEAPAPEPELSKAEQNRRDVEESRRLMAEAKARARQAQEPEPAVDPITQIAGEKVWGTPPRSTPTYVPNLTIEELHAENAAVMEATKRERVDGQRPGGEKMSTFARDTINRLLDLNAGFEYIPAQAGAGGGQGGKGKIVAPDGSRFTVATTFSGQDELRNLRRWLNRNGYLPTNGAPMSELRVPTKGKSSVKVIRKDGREYTIEQMAQVEATPEAPPLTDEEMDKSLFQTYSDCRAGLPLTLDYTVTEAVASLEAYPKDAVDRAVRDPDRVEVRPESKIKGYPVLKFVKGDVVVIMGFRVPKFPAVMRADWTQILANDTYRVNIHGGGGKKGSTGNPTSAAAVKSRLRQMGATIEESDGGKTASVTYKGQRLGLITIEKAQRMIHENDYNRMQRKMHAIDQREEAAV